MGKNLKGSTLEKNARDLTFKLYSLKESKSSRKGEYRTHSHSLLKTRETQMKEFIKYLRDNNLDDGSKLNLKFDDKTVLSFLEDRTVLSSKMTFKSQETYIRTFGAIIEGLRVQGVDIPLEKEKLDNYVKGLKQNYTPKVETGKSFSDVNSVINKLYEKDFGSGLLSETLNSCGLRLQEGINLILNYKKFIQIKVNSSKGVIKNLKGKGGRTYINKVISKSLIDKIKYFHSQNLKLPSKKGFTNSIQDIEKGKTPHSFRYEYVKQNHLKNLKNGMSYKESLKSLSLCLNHTRQEISLAYLNRS